MGYGFQGQGQVTLLYGGSLGELCPSPAERHWPNEAAEGTWSAAEQGTADRLVKRCFAGRLASPSSQQVSLKRRFLVGQIVGFGYHREIRNSYESTAWS